MEKSDLETERLRLVEDVLEHRATMKELEDNLLEKLTSVEGSLVDDEELIIVLQDTKQTAEEVSKKLTVASETETKINTARFATNINIYITLTSVPSWGRKGRGKK